MNTEKVELRMVQTTEKSRIGYLTYKGPEFHDLRYFDRDMPVILDSINYQIYALSEKEINVGDYALLPDGTIKLMSFSDILDLINSESNSTKKIVATTNNELNILKIPVGDVLYYIREYNDENVIKFAEYSEYTNLDHCPYGECESRYVCDSCREFIGKNCSGISAKRINL